MPKSETASELVPLPAACVAAGISYARAWAEVTAGRIPHERRGARILVKPHDLKRLSSR